MELSSFDGFQIAAKATTSYPERGENIFNPVTGIMEGSGLLAVHLRELMDNDGGEIVVKRKKEMSEILGLLLISAANVAEELDMSLNDIAVAAIEHNK